MALSVKTDRVEEKDLDQLTKLLYSCKFSLAINRLIIQDWPNDAVQQKLYRGALDGALHAEAIEDWKATDDDTGDIVGYIAFTIQEPKNQDAPDFESNEKNIPEGVVPELHEAVTLATNVLEKASPDVRRIEAVYTGVGRQHRRRGVGSTMLEKCLIKGKELGLPIIVHAEPAAKSYFDHLGFKEFAHANIDLAKFAAPFSGFGNFRLTGMIYEHQTE